MFGLTPQHMNQLGPKHRRVVSSPDGAYLKDIDSSDRMNKSVTSAGSGSSGGAWVLMDKDVTGKDLDEVPGTPPPPYLTSPLPHSHHQHHPHSHTQLLQHQQNFDEQDNCGGGDQSFGSPNISYNQQITAAQANLTQKPIISMEDDDLSDQEGFIDEHGPFKSLSRLLEQENTSHLAVFLNFVLSNSDPAPLLFYLITGLYKEGTVKEMRKWAYEIHSTFLVPRAVS